MSFHSILLQPTEEQMERGWNGPLPFYMTYPEMTLREEEEKALRDLEYLQQMYSREARRYQKRIAEVLDKMDYEGSMIYDEYPDRLSLRAVCDAMMSILKQEEENPPAELVQVLLYYEIYRRRLNGKSKRFRLFVG